MRAPVKNKAKELKLTHVNSCQFVSLTSFSTVGQQVILVSAKKPAVTISRYTGRRVVLCISKWKSRHLQNIWC